MMNYCLVTLGMLPNISDDSFQHHQKYEIQGEIQHSLMPYTGTYRADIPNPQEEVPLLCSQFADRQGRICQYVVSCMVLNCIGTLRHNIVTLSLDDLRQPHRTSRRLQIQPTTTAFVTESSLSGSVSIIELFL